jgi:hypothetical protein
MIRFLPTIGLGDDQGLSMSRLWLFSAFEIAEYSDLADVAERYACG